MSLTEQGPGREGLPLVRLSLLLPFVAQLERRRVESDAILGEFGLSRSNLRSPDVFVPALVIYQLVEAMAKAADDPFLGVHVGETLDIFSWPVLTEAARNAGTLGDFFLRFSEAARDQASSVQLRVEADGQYAKFRAYRVFEPAMAPAQVDAFYVGLLSTLLRRSAGPHWSPRDVLVRVCDPGVIPKSYHDLVLAEGDRRGGTIRFPQAWLLLPFDVKDFEHRTRLDVAYRAPPRSLQGAIRHALLPHIHRADLTVAQAAELCGHDRRALGRKLREKGTTLAREIARVREEQAVRMLSETDRSVAEIASAVGFADPTTFTRSFKRWSGMSPRDYRRKHTAS